MQTILPTSTQMEGFLLDRGVQSCLLRIERVSIKSNGVVLSQARGGPHAYLAVTNHTVSLILIWVDSGVQRPVYYVNKSLQDAETRYSHVEKVILALVHATKKLPHYFQAHMVVVLTQRPLQAVL